MSLLTVSTDASLLAWALSAVPPAWAPALQKLTDEEKAELERQAKANGASAWNAVGYGCCPRAARRAGRVLSALSVALASAQGARSLPLSRGTACTIGQSDCMYTCVIGLAATYAAAKPGQHALRPYETRYRAR